MNVASIVDLAMLLAVVATATLLTLHEIGTLVCPQHAVFMPVVIVGVFWVVTIIMRRE